MRKIIPVMSGLLFVVAMLSGCGNSVVSVTSTNGSGVSPQIQSEGIMPVGHSVVVETLQHDTGDAYELRIDKPDGTWQWFGTDSAVYINKESTPDGSQSINSLGQHDSILTIKSDNKVTQKILTRLPNQGDTTVYVLDVPLKQQPQGGTISDQIRTGKTTETVTTNPQILGQSK